MRAVDIIARKRDRHALTSQEITWFIEGFTRGDIPDYQAAAWLMAVALNGMDDRETADLTMAMAQSGDMLDLEGIARPVVDKHSTGGVGDKITLVVAPMVAATGLAVGKMSGRGLGFSGGTLDKLESFAGLTISLGTERFLQQLRLVGLVIAGQSADLAPADGKLYALRDVTATVESVPLIASSIMSKKIAAGADAIVLDVKVGRGAFMKTEADAIALANAMVDIGKDLGRRVAAVISSMDQPLGHAVGNALEVAEAIETLRGRGPDDLLEVALAVGAHMLALGEKAPSVDAGRAMLLETIGSGRALSKLREMVAAQGGDVRQVDDPALLPRAPVILSIPAPRNGYVTSLDPLEIALTAVELGAGRARKGDPIDPGVGIVVGPKVGQPVRIGAPLAMIHAQSEEAAEDAAERALAAYHIGDASLEPPPVIRRVID